jgi:hypothetical protein
MIHPPRLPYFFAGVLAFFFVFFTFGFSFSGLCGVFNALLSAASKRAVASFFDYSSFPFGIGHHRNERATA